MMSGMSTGIGTATANTLAGDDYYDSALAHAEMREDTAVQRAVTDMKAAGINPILGFTGTGAASSAASSSNVSAQASIKAQKIASLIGIVSSAMSLAAGIPGLSNAYHGTNIGFRK